MTLSEYLHKENKKIADVSRALKIKHCVVRRWVLGLAIPSKENMQKIVQYTGGKVLPNDFYDGVE